MFNSDSLLTWSSYLKNMQEAEAFQAQLQGDVTQIESGSLAEAEAGWLDLSENVGDDSTWASLMNDPNSSVSSKLQSVQGAAVSYMQGVELEVAQPNAPSGSYIPLYAGTSGSDGNGGIDENFQDIDANGNPVAANLYELISGGCSNLFNDASDAYYDNAGGPGPGLGTNWSQSGSLNFTSEWDGNPNDNGQYCSASGSVAAWTPYIQLGGGDSSGLNHALMA